MIHKIYGALIGALVNNAVEDGEEDVGSRHVFSLTRVLAHLEKQKKILLCRRENLILPVVGNQFGYFLLVKPISLALGYGIHRLGILYAIAASMHEIPSFLSISATLLNEKFVLPERMRLTY